MANAQTSGSTANGRFVEMSVDVDPGAPGYGCEAICIQKTRGMGPESLFAYIKSIGTGAEITLMWSDDNITFYAYEDSPYTTAPQRVQINDNSAGLYWKWAVLSGKQGTTTANIAGLSW